MRVLMPKQESAFLEDPSQLYRPDKTNKKEAKEFRNYTENVQTENVRRTYREMHVNQCMEFVQRKKQTWLNFDHAEMTIMEAVTLLDSLVDESDPDVDLPNSIHAFQTAERIREKHPDKDWFQLTGLIHDLGKVLALWGEPQWCVVGDTFPVGCAFQDACVYSEYFKENPDYRNPLYNTQNGIYSANCGLDNIVMSWGHDEYLYQVLVKNECNIPAEGLYMVRYHSFYPYHTSGAYKHLCSQTDNEMFPWLKEFNSFDLYSKSNEIPDVEAIKPYYQSLIDKYVPGLLLW